MPYGISNTQPDCSGWATVKKNSDGSFETVACHDTKQDAITQMVAVSMSEKIEPMGDVTRRSRDEEVVVVDMDETMVTKSRYPIREVVDAVNRLAHRVVIVTGREEEQRERTIEDLRYAAIGYDDLLMLPELGQDIAAFKRDAVQELMRDYEVIAFIDDNGDNRDAVESLGVYVMTPEEFVEAARESGLFDDYGDDEDESDDEDEPESEFETRAEVNRVAPGFMAASARRGLRLHQEGHSGDGLMPATVADARRMAEGEPLSEGKWRRIPGWIARHMMDLDAVDGDEITPGLVAMLLWGGGSSKSSARRAQAYAERVVERLDGNEERKNQPRDPDGKFASTGGGASAATDGGGDGGGGAAGESKPKKAPASKQQSGYSKAKPGSEKYANDTEKKMREEQASAVGDAVLSSPERAAISGYTETGHKNINKSLRGAPPPPLSDKQQESAAKRAATINGVIDKAPPTTAPIVVHRGVSTKALGVSSVDEVEGLVGGEFTDKGIVSTSLSPKVANRFVAGREPTVRMQVNVPAGSKAYAIPDELEYFNPIDVGASFEREVLLPSNTRFKITGFDKKTSTVTVDVVPGEGRAALDDGEVRYDALQPRAPDGKWTSGGGGFSSGDVNTGEGGGGSAGGGSATAGGGDAPRASRPGMGDIPLDSDTVAVMRGGSAEKHLVTLPDGTVQFTPERQALHDKIVKDTVDGIPPSANPTFHMMGGGAAAGKSSMVRSGAVEVPGEGKAAQLNVDHTRTKLPEYGAMTAAGDKSASAFTHEEASFVTKRAQQAAFERKVDVVLDGTGDSSEKSLSKKIDTAHANGYEVKGYYATVPVSTAIARSDARGSDPNSPDFGRFVPHTVITAQHQAVARVLPNVAPKFDSVQLFDTSGAQPRLLMQGGKGSMTIVDQAGFDTFKAIGGG